jgi:hypothetical protein
MMRSLISIAVVLSVASLAAAQSEDKQTVKESNAPAAQVSPIGHWNVEGLTLSYAKGEKEIFTEKGEKAISATFSEKTIALWLGSKMFAEMAYVIDPSQTPATIDAKYDGRELLGICEINHDTMFIRLNDAKQGRPKSLDDKEVGIAMDLTRIQSDAILFLNADGSESACLEPMVEYSSCGSPRWSRDGSKIVLDAWRSWCGENARLCHVIVANPDGSEMKDLGLGAIPSVSPNSKLITFCQYSPDSGIWIMNIDGSDRKLIDSEGWCPDWTTNNEEVVYTVYTDGGANLRVCNTKTGKFRHLFKASKYRQIFWGLSCSSDGKWVCFRGTLPNGESELAIISTEGEDKGFKVLLPNDAAKDVTYFDNYVNWTPDNKRVTALLRTKDRPEIQLYYLDLEGKTAPKWLSGQEPSTQRYCCSWSPDGKKLLTAGKPSKPAVKPEKSEKENAPTP